MPKKTKEAFKQVYSKAREVLRESRGRDSFEIVVCKPRDNDNPYLPIRARAMRQENGDVLVGVACPSIAVTMAVILTLRARGLRAYCH